MKRLLLLTGFGLLALGLPLGLPAQVVGVTARLDTNTLAIGQTTTLHILAQVLPANRAAAERIFSWYLDVLNTNGAAATANYAAMLRTASDRDPQTSSNGFSSGANRLGIYDTFLNRPGAGVTNPVELMTIPITAVAAGQTRFAARHGTSAALSADFIVAPLSGGSFLTGGDYSSAFADLTVLGGAPNNFISCLTLTHTALAGGLHKATLQFCPLPGYDHLVEYRDTLASTSGWQTFPGGPFNTGIFQETNSVPLRFYRVRAVPAGSLLPFRVTLTPVSAGQMRVTFPTQPGYNYTLLFLNSLGAGTWQPWPGGPHNSGNVILAVGSAPEFFRVSAVKSP